MSEKPMSFEWARPKPFREVQPDDVEGTCDTCGEPILRRDGGHFLTSGQGVEFAYHPQCFQPK